MGSGGTEVPFNGGSPQKTECVVVNDVFSSGLVHGAIKRKRPVSIFVDGSVACFVLADEFLTLTEIREAYAKWTGFDVQSVQCGLFGLNVLSIDRMSK